METAATTRIKVISLGPAGAGKVRKKEEEREGVLLWMLQMQIVIMLRRKFLKITFRVA